MTTATKTVPLWEVPAIRTLRPGLLVSLKTSTEGNVQYNRVDLEADHVTKRGTKEARWETQRIISDPAEHEEAGKVRAKALSLIRGVCARSAFGLLCPEDRSDDLNGAVAEARRLVDKFNATAKLTRVNVYTIAGRIAPDDAEAVRAISSEIRDLVAVMTDGVKNLDASAVRAAANQARSVGRMLSPEAQKRVQDAIDVARKAARQIVKSGENAAQEIDKATLRKLREARTSFLDLDEGTALATPEAKRFAVDLDDGDKPQIGRPRRSPARVLELE